MSHLPFLQSWRREHWTTVQMCYKTWRWLGVGSSVEPTSPVGCSGVESQWEAVAGGRGRTDWAPGSACSDGSSYDDPRQLSCTSSEPVCVCARIDLKEVAWCMIKEMGHLLLTTFKQCQQIFTTNFQIIIWMCWVTYIIRKYAAIAFQASSQKNIIALYIIHLGWGRGRGSLSELDWNLSSLWSARHCHKHINWKTSTCVILHAQQLSIVDHTFARVALSFMTYS